MSTLNEDLVRMSNGLRHFTKHDVTQVDGAVYVNFDYATALTLEPEITEHGQVWYLEVVEWDWTGGVKDSRDLGSMREHIALKHAAEWLREWDLAQARLDAELASIPTNCADDA